MKNALNNQVGMLGDMFLWLVANLKQGVIYFIKQVQKSLKTPLRKYKNGPFYQKNLRKVLKKIDGIQALFTLITLL